MSDGLEVAVGWPELYPEEDTCMHSKPRIIVVDDKLAMAETVADGLSDLGFETMAVRSGRAAVEAVRAGSVDILVTDLRMPDIDGLALIDAVRAAKLDVPVIVMTAYGAIDSAVESIRKGAYHYVTKPFKLDELVLFVHRALTERALRRETAELRKSLGEQATLPFSGEVVPMIEIQRRYARWALEQLGGHRTRTAERLDVDAKTLNRWLAIDDGAGSQ